MTPLEEFRFHLFSFLYIFVLDLSASRDHTPTFEQRTQCILKLSDSEIKDQSFQAIAESGVLGDVYNLGTYFEMNGRLIFDLPSQLIDL